MSKRWSNPKYLFQSKIGKGKTATVYKAIVLETGVAVAIKRIELTRISKDCAAAPQLVASEIEMLQRAKHKYINELLDSFTETHNGEEYVYLVLELCDETLSTYLKKFPENRLSEKRALSFMKQIAGAFYFLRSKKIMHRDIKPDNLLLKNERGILLLKISDFGLARQIEDNDISHTQCGTPLYMAPEILSGGSASNNADLYSIGVLFYTMLTGTVPFNGEDLPRLRSNVKNKRMIIPQDISLSDNCKDLLLGLIQKNPAERISWDQFFTHPWFEGEDFTFKKVPLASASNPQIHSRPNSSPFIVESSPTKHSHFYHACKEIVKLAKQQLPDEAVALYIKCAQDTKRHLELLLKNSGMPSTLEVSQDIILCKELFLELLSEIKHERESGAMLSAQSPDNLIFKHAMKIGERAANKEVIQIYEKSADLYFTAICLLEYLKKRPCDTIHPQVLEASLTRFQNRYKRVQTKRGTSLQSRSHSVLH